MAIFHPAPAAARSNGIATPGCIGCHDEGDNLVVSLTTEPATVLPGAEVIVSVTVENPGIEGAGAYVSTEGSGTLRAISGEGMTEVSGGLSHTTPKRPSGGRSTFRFAWTPPGAPGGTTIAVYAVAGNGNRNNSGDSAGTKRFDVVYGCSPQEFYYDGDGDGFGGPFWPPILRCAGAPPERYALMPGDCDDNRETAYPGAEEFCNKRDDDCDGEIDEDALPVELWPDEDGDGYYRFKEGESIIGCAGTRGYAAEGGDCRPHDPEIHPGAEEVCNLFDDNCDGRVDERVRPICGVGMCRRLSSNCSLDFCTPGDSAPEVCNGLDDNCDDVVDEPWAEPPLCEPGYVCIAAECRLASEVGLTDADVPGAPANPEPGGDPPVPGPTTGPAAESASGGCSVTGVTVPRSAAPVGGLLLLALSLLPLVSFRRRRR